MPFSKITSKGQITIPKSIRKKFNLQPGDKLDFRVENGEIKVICPRKSIVEIFGILKKDNQQVLSIDEINKKFKDCIRKKNEKER